MVGAERYVPELDAPEISYQHWHRYLYASQFVEDQLVLDIACGEGYGSYLLAQTAREVVGVDKSQETIDHAASKYMRKNLEFQVGLANNIPLKEKAVFDVVVSFETIEHLKEEDHSGFLSEVKRLLRPEGIFIISTPDKLFYTDIPNYRNEFHAKEYYATEFEDMLGEHFRNVRLLGQKIYPSSYVWGAEDQETRLLEYKLEFSERGFRPSSEPKTAEYLIAICSDGALKDVNSSILIDISERLLRVRGEQLANSERAVQELMAKLAERDRQVHAMTAQTAEGEQIPRQTQLPQVLCDERDRELQSLRTRLAHAEAQVGLIQSGLGFLLLSKFRSVMGWLLPHGTRRRRGYNLSTKGLRILLAEGPAGLCRRIRTRRARITSKDGSSHAKLNSQGYCTHEFQESSPKSSTITQQAYVETYASSVAVARGREGEDYVPLTEEEHPVEPSPVKLIAFYLPQFHPIPENDQWWGKGFTEWTNVSKAVPRFVGHYQPHLPGELGFYDLRVPEVQRRQAELAKKYGIYGFCFYYYWFNGKRLLERPLDQFLADPEIDLPFCLCWANENWTRRWDGAENDVLIAQEHSAESDVRFIRDIMPLLQHERYIRIHGRPLLIVYRAQDLPNPAATAKRWKRICRSRDVAEPYLVAAQTSNHFDPRKVGFDAAVQFPPHGLDQWDISTAFKILNSNSTGRIYNYLQTVEHMTMHQDVPYHVFNTVMPSWDNEPRKPGAGHSFVFSSPGAYRQWLIEAARRTLQETDHEKHMVFINAWNEWGEGAHLEPDRRYGFAYLQATADALRSLAIPNDEDSRTEATGPFDSRLVKQHDTAVILHLYYTDLWEEMAIYLDSLEGDFDLYVSVPNGSSFETKRIRDEYPHAHFYHCENRGRDIAPFLEIFRAIYPLRYKHICKIHAKKSCHREDGNVWRRELLSGLLGSCDVVRQIKLLIDAQSDLGIVTAKKHLVSARYFQGENLQNVLELTRMVSLPYDGEDFRFAAGSMFWCRPSALYPLTRLPVTTDQFEREQGQKDGTLAHAIERFIGLLPTITGFRVIGVAEDGKEQLSVEDNPWEYEYAEPTMPTGHDSGDK